MEYYELSEPLRPAGDQEMIRSYYETLLDAGLAVKISLHTTKGEYFGDDNLSRGGRGDAETCIGEWLGQRWREVKALNKIALIWSLRKGD